VLNDLARERHPHGINIARVESQLGLQALLLPLLGVASYEARITDGPAVQSPVLVWEAIRSVHQGGDRIPHSRVAAQHLLLQSPYLRILLVALSPVARFDSILSENGAFLFLHTLHPHDVLVQIEAAPMVHLFLLRHR